MNPPNPPPSEPSATPPPIRVAIQQPALPKYRVPVFRELAGRPGIDLFVAYGSMPDLPNVEPEGFAGAFTPLRRLKIAGREAMWHAPQLALAKRSKCDVLILSWNLHYASLVPALLRARAGGVRTILWGHGYSRSEARSRRFLRDKVGGLADALLFYGHKTAEAFVASDWPRERIHVAANSLDQTAIQANRDDWLGRPADLLAFRAEAGIGPGPVLLFVSRLIPENRIDVLLDAAATLRTRYPTLRVVLVGGGDQSTLRAQAERLGIADAIVFAGAVYEESRVAGYFLNADVFVYPAKLGLGIMHCFGYGVPIVTGASDAAQFPEREALVEGVNGMTFADGDSGALAATVEKILADPTRRKQMGEAALRTIRERYSVPKMVDGFEAAIRYVTQPGARNS